ncbi:MAG: cupin domain-containing protein [Phycisphaerales bacterium]
MSTVTTAPRPIVRHVDEAETIFFGGHPTAILLSGSETEGQFSMTELTIPAGWGPPPHVHGREHEYFYVLEGEITFYLDGKAMVARTGCGVMGPRGIKHCFRNTGSATARMLVMTTPGNFDAFVRDAGTPLPPGTRECGPMTEDDAKRLLGACPAHGYEMEG